jgi:hypothetical protein
MFFLCASLPLAMGVTALLCVALAMGTWLESRFGMALAEAKVYRAGWFRGTLLVLAINVLASLLIRFPWKREHAGLVLAHIGIELLLLGAFVGAQFGMDAQVHLSAGERTHTALLAQERLIIAEPRPNAAPNAYELNLSPLDQCDTSGHWPTDRRFTLPQVGDARVTILNWLSSAKTSTGEVGEFVESPVPPADLPHALKVVHLSVDFGGVTIDRWLPLGELATVQTARGAMRVVYAPSEKPLPFTLAVRNVKRESRLAGEQAEYIADVRFTSDDGTLSDQSVAVNQPATFSGISVYIGGTDVTDPANPKMTLNLRADPGRLLKYLGGLLIIAGAVGMSAGKGARR